MAALDEEPSTTNATEALINSKYEGGVTSPNAQDYLSSLQHDFGQKDIAMFSGVVLLINNITGPGVPGLPNMFVEAGWLFPTVVVIAVWGMTTLSATMYAEAMANIPGNEGWKSRIEYSTIVQYYFGRRWYLAAQLGLNGALQSLNIISVIQSAQVMDGLVAELFGKSCGINITPFETTWTHETWTNGTFTNGTWTNGTWTSVATPLAGSSDFFSCVDVSDVSQGNAWGCHVVLTLGFVMTAAMAIPAGHWNLDDNMVIQRVAFVLTVVCWIIWMVGTLAQADGSRSLPAINNDPNTGSMAGVVGAVLFNFGFVTTVPSWINEKKTNVSVNKSLWSATSLCVVIYLVIGIPGAIVFSDVLQGPVTATCARQVADPSFNCPNDLMQTLTQPATAPWQDSSFATFVLKASVYMFPIVAVVSSIPVFSIVIKYNLIENGMGGGQAFFWGVIFPWATAFPLLYMPNILAQFVNFTSLVFVSFTDFIVPFSLYVILQRRQANSERRGSPRRNMALDTEALVEDNPAAASSVGESSPSVGPYGDNDECFEHHALPEGCGRDSPSFKTNISIGLGTALVILSMVGIVLTIVQGSYQLDMQTCSLVGS